MMQNNKDILREHYIRLLRKVVAWGGLAVMVLAFAVPVPAQAAQITSRKATVGSSAAGAATTYDFTFNPGQTAGVGSIKFQICNSPLELTACAVSNSSTMVGGTFSTAAPTTAPFTSNWSLGTGGLVPTTTSLWIVRSSATDTLNSGTSYTIRLSNITNPNAANTSYYARITTYSDLAATTQVDYGAIALSTARQITASANVQESLTFCVGTSGTGCGGGGLTGTAVSLGTGTDNVLSTSTPSGGVSVMAADTNAGTGYIITYTTTSPGGTGGSTCPGSLSSTTDCITDSGGAASGFVAGTSEFGINLRNNATPDIGADATGSGSGTASSPYNTIDNYAFQGGATPRTVASAAGATLSNLYTVAYAAQAGNTTKPGAYSVTFTWVCTGTF